MAGAAGAAEAGDGFGSAVSVGEDGLWVGAPGENLGKAVDAGVVTRFLLPVKTAGSVQFQQGALKVPGTSESGDRFGASLAEGGTLIGAPGEDVGRIVDAGAVTWRLRYGLTQDSPGVPGAAEKGDRFGAAVSSVTQWSQDGWEPSWTRNSMVGVGAPGEDIGAAADAGAVTFGSDEGFLGAGEDPDECTTIVGLVDARVESGDRFGSSVSVSEDATRMVVGAPGEDVGATKDAGAVTAFAVSTWCDYYCDVSVDGRTTLDQNSAGVPGAVRSGSQFGATLAERPGAGNRGYVVGAPGAPVSGKTTAGTVITMPTTGLKQELHENSAGVPGAAAKGDRFGTLPGR